MKITLEDIFNLSTAVIYNPDLYKSVASVSIDTRTIKKNSLFVAIKGKNFDGHKYIKEAVKKGAAAVVVSNRKLNMIPNINVTIITVANTKKAYGELASIWRKKINAKVISITGSNGKTTTKEIITQLLKTKYKVHSTLSNNNNEIGVPLTILTAPKNTNVIVLEHGSNHFGEIEYTAKIAQPDFAVITNIGNSHLEFLKNKKGVLKEKIALFNNINNNGKIFINNDDELLRGIKRNYKNKITYGFKSKVDIKGKIKNNKKGKTKIEVKYGKGCFITPLPLPGEANAYNYLTAVAMCLTVGLTQKQIITGTKKIKQVPKRLQQNEFDDFTIIDDTYNSNPESVKNAIKLINATDRRKRKIVILGDMFELGKNAEKQHKEIAKNINGTNINVVLTIGRNSKFINNKLNKNIFAKHFATRKALKNYLEKIELTDSLILVKGSRGMEMEEFVEALKKRVA